MEIPILGFATIPDSTGKVFIDKVKNQLSLASAPGEELCFVMQEPAGGGDAGLYGRFVVPGDYSSTPVLRIIGILDGTPANTLAFGVRMKPLADSEAYDAALASEDTASNGTWTGYADEDVYLETISLSTPTFAAGDVVDYYFYWDDSVASPYTGNFLLLALVFQYTAA